jgi:hypothetical protein
MDGEYLLDMVVICCELQQIETASAANMLLKSALLSGPDFSYATCFSCRPAVAFGPGDGGLARKRLRSWIAPVSLCSDIAGLLADSRRFPAGDTGIGSGLPLSSRH